MHIQSINTNYGTSKIGFKRFRVEKNSFVELKNFKYFPNEETPNYHKMLLDFYKKLKDLKTIADKNDLYDVVVKSKNKDGVSGGYIAIQNKEGIEQTGFVYPFNDLFRIKGLEKIPYVSKEQTPNLFIRTYKNWQIKKHNKTLEKTPLDYLKILDIMLARINSVITTANSLKEMETKCLLSKKGELC